MDRSHAYRVKFNDGFEAAVHHEQLVPLSIFKGIVSIGEHAKHLDANTPTLSGATNPSAASGDLHDRIVYRCVIGSRAYGLEDDESDTDRRGIYLPPAELHWSLYGVPEQLENEETQEAYWEIQKFIILALKANPNVLECLYSPIIELATPLAEELLAMREAFLFQACLSDLLGIRCITIQKDADGYSESRKGQMETCDAFDPLVDLRHPCTPRR